MKKRMDKNCQNFCEWVSCVSLLGVFGSVCWTLFQFGIKKQWSYYWVVYSLNPFWGFNLIYICCYGFVKRKFNYSIPYWNKHTKKIVLGLIAVYIGSNIMLWNINKEVKYEKISLAELKNITSYNNSDFFVLFGSRNCIYCKQMEDVYKEAFAHQDRAIYYVDMSNERIDDEYVQKHNITRLPMLIQYNRGKELKRSEGIVPVEQLIEFIDSK